MSTREVEYIDSTKYDMVDYILSHNIDDVTLEVLDDISYSISLDKFKEKFIKADINHAKLLMSSDTIMKLFVMCLTQSYLTLSPNYPPYYVHIIKALHDEMPKPKYDYKDSVDVIDYLCNLGVITSETLSYLLIKLKDSIRYKESLDIHPTNFSAYKDMLVSEKTPGYIITIHNNVMKYLQRIEYV
jgi:hypothetical protein